MLSNHQSLRQRFSEVSWSHLERIEFLLSSCYSAKGKINQQKKTKNMYSSPCVFFSVRYHQTIFFFRSKELQSFVFQSFIWFTINSGLLAIQWKFIFPFKNIYISINFLLFLLLSNNNEFEQYVLISIRIPLPTLTPRNKWLTLLSFDLLGWGGGASEREGAWKCGGP